MSLILGASPTWREVLRAVERVAATDATVLLLGETGTGKEVVARHIHAQSRRASRSFVPVSCVALVPGLMNSELFGHEAGAFTGAVKRRIGRFEQADHGTLFLDEIGELSIDTQAMLLRVLQERMIERVGGEAVAVDVRLLAATHRDLPREITAGRFRADVFYRLNVFPISLPPLRERREDILPLAEHFMHRFAEQHRRAVTRIPAAIVRALSAHDWPGNVRELQNIVERAVLLSDADTLAVEPAWLIGASVTQTPQTWAAQERQRILDALRATDGRVYGPGGAAHRLGLNPTTLYGKMRKHNLRKSGTEWI